ncbi:hypothetical protein D3C72_1941730 [compost metagenome]
MQAAAVLPLQAGDAAQQGGLATAGGPQQAHQFALGDIQAHPAQGGEVAEALVDVAHLHMGGVVIGGGHGGTSLSGWRARVHDSTRVMLGKQCERQMAVGAKMPIVALADLGWRRSRMRPWTYRHT